MEKDRHMVEYGYLRERKAQVLKEWHEKNFELFTPTATQYDQAVILPLKKIPEDNLLFGRGGLVDEDDRYIDDSGIPQRIWGDYGYDHCEQSDRRVVYCGYLVRHWGHFLVEATARLWYFLEEDNSVDSYVFFSEENAEYMLDGNYREFFSMLGILDKIEIINSPTRYRQVVLPELSYRWRTGYSREYKKIFEKISERVQVGEDIRIRDKIFFTRSGLKKVGKLEPGTDMLDNYFEKNGYKIISPEKISLSEMIGYIKGAKICATVSGTLPHNMLFGDDEKELIIIERNVLNNEIQVDINRMKRLNVTYIDGNISIYPVNVGYGPVILAYEGMLQRYTKDKGMIPCDSGYRGQRFLKKALRSI